MWAGSYNAFRESVEEKTNAEQWEFSRTTLQLTCKPLLYMNKTPKQYIENKNSNDILNITQWAGYQPKMWDLCDHEMVGHCPSHPTGYTHPQMFACQLNE